MSAKKEKFYVIWEGHEPGVYDAWSDASKQVVGFARAKFKSFSSRSEAEAAFEGRYWDYAGKDTTTITKSLAELEKLGVRLDSVAVDAACSGPPGPMEYRGIYIRTGAQLFHSGPYADGTNNIGEFLAIVHALALLKRQGIPDTPIYTDSRTAQSWIRQKTCRTKLQQNPQNVKIFELISRALIWLRDNPATNPILKWETEQWGEVPADFGRKS